MIVIVSNIDIDIWFEVENYINWTMKAILLYYKLQHNNIIAFCITQIREALTWSWNSESDAGSAGSFEVEIEVAENIWVRTVEGDGSFPARCGPLVVSRIRESICGNEGIHNGLRVKL